jgi:hypothetical protein
MFVASVQLRIDVHMLRRKHEKSKCGGDLTGNKDTKEDIWRHMQSVQILLLMEKSRVSPLFISWAY